MGVSIPARRSSPFPAHSSRRWGSLEARPHARWGLHLGCRWPRGVTCTPETGLCSHTGGCSATPGTWPAALQRRAWLLYSWAWCQAGRRLEKGLFQQELRVLPVWGYPRGLAPQSSGTWGLSSSQISPFFPSPTRACSDPLSPRVLTQVHAPQSLHATGELLGCRLQSIPNLAVPSPGPSSPHISIQHGARVEGGEGVAVRGLLWRVQLERLRGTAWRERGDTGQLGTPHEERHPAVRRRRRKDAGPAKPPSAQAHPSSVTPPRCQPSPFTPHTAPGLPHAGWDLQSQG